MPSRAGFLTGALQKHARKHLIPIDAIDFAFEVTTIKSDEELAETGPPEDGCYVRGLFIGARPLHSHLWTTLPLACPLLLRCAVPAR